ncbi:MAG: ComEC/Rec2 family competence protein [Patescibacteria group bacterium]|nr:ComEC/Rec2 family competence protein [Patescibacteria group bacterium]MDD5164802.1 ComEC/Rec2 family competence protein [Patescibacteria group bacterium]MDD5534433.1 ComEC/Rec2 family competence protein [Patescibacteria group bacterium]
MAVSRIVFYCLLFFIGGIGLASFFYLPFFVYLPVFLLILFFCVLKRPFRNIWPFVFFVIFFTLGVIRYNLSFPKIDENNVAFYNNTNLIFEGQVISEPDVKTDKTQLTVGKINNNQFKGKVLISAPLYSDYQYGDLLEVDCQLKGVLDNGFKNNAAIVNDIYSVCYFPKITNLNHNQGNFLYQKIFLFKNQVKNLIDQSFSEPQGSVFSALLLGLQRQIPQEVRNWFSTTGTTHILSVSGLHVAILSQLIMIFIVSVLLIRRQIAFWLAAILIIFFVILVGAPAAAVRAAIMGLGILYAQKIGRPQSGLRIVIWAAAIMLLINPKLLVLDIGFQLSFASILGLIFFTPIFNQYFKKIPNLRYLPIKDCLSATFSAQVFVFPLILYYFGTLSLAAPLANILILPIIPVLMFLGIFFILFGTISVFLAKILFWPIWLGLTFLILTVKIIAKIFYFSPIIINFPLIAALILYFFIVWWLIYAQKTQSKNS